jgi:hypothetical protein
MRLSDMFSVFAKNLENTKVKYNRQERRYQWDRFCTETDPDIGSDVRLMIPWPEPPTFSAPPRLSRLSTRDHAFIHEFILRSHLS